jgi:hypothetical protein
MTAALIKPDRAAENNLDPQRKALATAIANEWKAVTARTSAQDDLMRARHFVEEAEAAVLAKTEAVDFARGADAEMAAKAVRTRTDVPGTSATRTARRELEDSEDALEISRAALTALESDAAKSDATLARRRNAVLTARAELLASVARQILERAAAARFTLAVSQAVLHDLLNTDERDAPEYGDDVIARISAKEERRAPLAEVTADARRFALNPESGDEGNAARLAVEQMRAVTSALVKDASVALPPLP